jgi:hypothetical protein
MELKITKKCDRCGKAEEYIGTLEDAQKRNDQVQTRLSTSAHLDEVVRELSCADEPPMVVVMLLNPETKEYAYKTLYDLCNKKVEKEGQRRGCTSRVADLVADIFNTKDESAEPKQRKQRKPQEKKVVQPPQRTQEED